MGAVSERERSPSGSNFRAGATALSRRMIGWVNGWRAPTHQDVEGVDRWAGTGLCRFSYLPIDS